MCGYVLACTWYCVCVEIRGQIELVTSIPPPWVSGAKFKSSSLVVSAFIHRAIWGPQRTSFNEEQNNMISKILNDKL